jgi:hypothetical protein
MQTLFIPMFGDFAEETRAETNRWFDLDHVPQRLTCPGFLRAERYQLAAPSGATSEVPPLRYLNVYYIESAEVLTSEAYRRQVEARTPWSARRRGSGLVGPLLRAVWVEQPVQTRTARLRAAEGPRTWLVRMRSSDEEDVVGVLSCPGVVAAAHYASVEVEMPGPRPVEPPGFMTIYDLDSPEAVSTPEFRAHTDETSALWQGVYLQRPSPWTLRPV